MIQLHLHGILGHKYGKLHKLAVQSPKGILDAMEANFPEFRKDLKDLALKSVHYTFVSNGEWLKGASSSDYKINNTKVDMVPSVLGSGVVLFTYGAAATAFTLLDAVLIVATIGSAVLSYVMAGKVDYPKIPGATGTSSALNKSLKFSNRENLIEQGNPVPIVYGRFKVGSFVIQSSLKSFPLSLTLTDEFVNTSSKKSSNQTAVIDGSNSELTSVSQINTFNTSINKLT